MSGKGRPCQHATSLPNANPSGCHATTLRHLSPAECSRAPSPPASWPGSAMNSPLRHLPTSPLSAPARPSVPLSFLCFSFSALQYPHNFQVPSKGSKLIDSLSTSPQHRAGKVAISSPARGVHLLLMRVTEKAQAWGPHPGSLWGTGQVTRPS